MVHYNGLIDVLKKGDYRYDGSAWEGSRIGHNYGGETIQGVVPFYFQIKAGPKSYHIVRPVEPTLLVHDGLIAGGQGSC